MIARLGGCTRQLGLDQLLSPLAQLALKELRADLNGGRLLFLPDPEAYLLPCPGGADEVEPVGRRVLLRVCVDLDGVAAGELAGERCDSPVDPGAGAV